MKIIVLSDTHSNVRAAVGVLRREDDADLFFHLGDTYQDALRIREETGLAMRAVSGNMDGLRIGPKAEVFSLEGVNVLLVHGDCFSVHRDRSRLNAEAGRLGATLVCYGHTHVARDETIGSRRLINPGSLRPGGSYGVLTLGAGDPVFQLRRV